MTEDFAVLDFAFLALPPTDVALSLNALRLEVPEETEATTGMLSRLVGRGAKTGPRPLLVHASQLLPQGPHARIDISDNRVGSDMPVRLSIAPGDSGMTLLEFVETEVGQSSIARGLSARHPEAEVYYFRYSGARHPGADFAFHVYKAGRATRRASALSFKGNGPEANWTATDFGTPHAAEAACLPSPNTPRNEVMTPAHQGMILEALGVDPEKLFSANQSPTEVLVLSPKPGGQPLDELVGIVSQDAPDAAPPVDEPVQMAPENSVVPTQEPEPSPQPTEREAPAPTDPEPERPAVAEAEPDPPAAPEPETEEIADTPDVEPETVAEPAVETFEQADPDPEPMQRETEPQPVESPIEPDDLPLPAIGSKDWEDEVTRLLLEAVEAGLPPAEQVPWLDHLTRQLEAGQVTDAIANATDLIRKGNRSVPAKEHAISRLTALYRAPTPR